MGLGKARRKMRLHACPDAEALASPSSLVQRTTRPPFPAGSQGRSSGRQAICSHGGGPRPAQGLPAPCRSACDSVAEVPSPRSQSFSFLYEGHVGFTPFCPSVCLALSPHVVSLKFQSLSLSSSAFRKPASWNILLLVSILPLLHPPRAPAVGSAPRASDSHGRGLWTRLIFRLHFLLLFISFIFSHITSPGLEEFILNSFFCKVIFSHLKSS